jgi:hypothetical protein
MLISQQVNNILLDSCHVISKVVIVGVYIQLPQPPVVHLPEEKAASNYCIIVLIVRYLLFSENGFRGGKGCDMRFLASGFFHESVSPGAGPLSILLWRFRIFLKICGDFCE